MSSVTDDAGIDDKVVIDGHIIPDNSVGDAAVSANERREQQPRPLSPGVLQAFMRYPWPGNVRELENACERIAQTCTCDTVKIRCVPISVLFHRSSELAEPVIETHSHPSSVSLEDRLLDVEQGLITWALKVAGGNKSKAAQILSVSRKAVYDKLGRREIHERPPADTPAES